MKTLVAVAATTLVLLAAPASAFADGASSGSTSGAARAEPTFESLPKTATRLRAGLAYRQVFDIPMYAVDLGIGAGPRMRTSGFYGTGGGRLGTTPNGLLTLSASIGVLGEKQLGYLRFGAAVMA
jgi:hypothetical protein